jgi:hypothetical protein
LQLLVAGVTTTALDADFDVKILPLCLASRAKTHALNQLVAWMPDADKTREHLRIASDAFTMMPPFTFREKLVALTSEVEMSKSGKFDKRLVRAFLDLNSKPYQNSWNSLQVYSAKQTFSEILPNTTGYTIDAFLEVVKGFADKDWGFSMSYTYIV